MFERPRGGERALLINVGRGAAILPDDVEELSLLAQSAGAQPVGQISAVRQAPDPRLYIGAGKAEEIALAVQRLDAELVVFDQALSPSQERNLERQLGCRVLDRTGLILDIFAQRARSAEGKLQVELAQLRHLSTRLVRGWTHLERQKGGIGLRGPGETQLETDRRLIAQRIRSLRAKLDKVETQRTQQRRQRARARMPTIALVGYTNAGKSTLFNRLTMADAYAADQLFATLDPTVRRVELAAGNDVIVADTVGFVRDLPHELVAAFRATLQETREAALLLHVIDASDENRGERINQVEQTLGLIGAGEVPCIRVYNKCDLSREEPRVDRDAGGAIRRVWLSSLTGEGLGALREVASEALSGAQLHTWVELGPDEGRLRARLFEEGLVRHEIQHDDGRIEVELLAEEGQLRRIARDLGLAPDRLVDRPCMPDDPFLQSDATTL